MIGKSVEGWHWQWKEKFLRLWSPKGGVAAIISFNPKLGWIWSLRESLGHKATDEQAAVRDALAALEMEERVRARLLAIALEEFAQLRKIEAENDAKSADSDGEEVA